MRVLEAVYDDAKQRAVLCDTAVSLSIYEIRNERLQDLLPGAGGAGGAGAERGLRVVDDVRGNGEVQGLSWCPADSVSKALGLLTLGLSCGREAQVGGVEGGGNGGDGRSHVVVQVRVRVKHKLHAEGEAGPPSTEGTLMFVDLAGSDVGVVGS